MPATYKGEVVTVIRPATPEDAGFQPEAVLIRLSDGTDKIVPGSDVIEREAALAGEVGDDDDMVWKDKGVDEGEAIVPKPKVKKVADKTIWNRKGKKK